MRLRQLIKPIAAFLCLVAVVLVLGWSLLPPTSATAGASSESAPPPPSPKAEKERRVLYWWDPMLGPSSISNHPGKSAMGMEMVPFYSDQASGSPQLTIDPQITQAMGVQTAPVTRGPLRQTLRLVGLFELPEPGLHDVTLKVGGWIDTLYANQNGMHVNKGDPLFAVYSPELQVASQELISAAKARRSLLADAATMVRAEADSLVNSARRKLQLWDVNERELDAIARLDQAPRDIIFRSPAEGHLEEKAVIQGSAVQPGTKLLRIADHTKMWLDLQVYEQQIPLVRIGQTVEANLDAMPGKTFMGAVTFVYPHLDQMTRTLTVRSTFDNPDFALKPGMYAQANIIAEPIPDAVQVPQEAVIDTGTKQIVFIAQGDGHFSPRTVRTGVWGDDDKIQILEGLEVGQTVVTSGQFLMDVESRTQEAIAKLRGTAVAKPMEGPPASQPALTSGTLALAYCPMVKAQWVQTGAKVANPYLGDQMPDCGQVQSQLPAPPNDSPLAGVVRSYLQVQQALSAGRLDAAAVKSLKASAEGLHGDAFKSLRQSCMKFAASPDLKTAQAQFQSVSAGLIPLLKEQPNQ